MDLQTLSREDIRELLKAIEASKSYDKVIIDLGNGLHEKEIMVTSMANRVVMIMDHAQMAEIKLERYLKCVQAVEETKRVDIISKMCIYFNRTLKSEQLPEHILQIRINGAFPLIENGNYAGIVDRISKMELLQSIK